MNPLRAIRDLRLFLHQRRPHELGFLALAIVLTTLLIAGFVHDSYEPIPYKRNIIYVKQWRLDRSEAEILAQQKIDTAAKKKADAELEAQRKKNQAEFKRLDDSLKRWGL